MVGSAGQQDFHMAADTLSDYDQHIGFSLRMIISFFNLPCVGACYYGLAFACKDLRPVRHLRFIILFADFFPG
jgi:hypothetical protein